jgi:hypothetical protein
MSAVLDSDSRQGRSLYISIYAARVIDKLVDVVVSATPQSALSVDVLESGPDTSVIKQSHADLIKEESPMTRVKGLNVKELASMFVVFSTLFGIVVGTAFPGEITGAILPLALVGWYVLYRVIEQDNT